MILSNRLRQLLEQACAPDDATAQAAALKFFRLAKDKGVALTVSVEEGKDVELLEGPAGPAPEYGSVEHALAEAARAFPGGVLPPRRARG